MVNEQPLDAVADEVADPAGRARDDASAAGEALDHDAAEPLEPRGQDEQPRLVHPTRDLLGRQLLDVFEPLDERRQRPLADDDEAGRR